MLVAAIAAAAGVEQSVVRGVAAAPAAYRAALETPFATARLVFVSDSYTPAVTVPNW